MFKNFAVTLKYTLLFGIVALIGAGGYFFFSKQSDGESTFKTEIGGPKGIKSKIKNLHLTEKLGKGDVWELTALAVSVNDRMTEMEDINMVYYSAERGTINLSSNTGILHSGSQNASFIGNVRLRSPKPLLLITEQLDWNVKTRLLTTDKKVRIETGGAVINGIGLVINAESQDLAVKHFVKATFN
jgi:LPS export ABC transporter protein LptC